MRFIALDNYYHDNGLENPLAKSFRRWTKTPDDIMVRVTTQVKYDGYFQ